MTRKEHLQFCKKCLNRKLDLKQGIICNITQKPANFEGSCENFKLDETVKEDQVDENELIPNEEVIHELNENAINNLKYYQDFYFAVVGGLLAAFISAVIWAVVTVSTEYQIGFMAIGVGLLVGFSVQFFGAGIEKKFGILGAVIALVGCLLGNLFSQVGFVAQAQSYGYIETLSYLNFGIIVSIMAESFNPMDLVFYGIAVYEGYRFSFRKITVELLVKLHKGEYDGLPANQKLRLPLVITSILVLALFIFKVNQGVNGFKTYTYESGKKMSEGEMVKSKEQGKWTYWYENGNLQITGHYIDGNPDGTWEWYNEEGILTRKGQYKNGMEQGTWITYYENGNMSDSGSYSDTRIDGLWKYWYENGVISQVGYFKRNKQDSTWITYYENGQIGSIGKFTDGEPTGIWKTYFEDGQLAEEIEYVSEGQNEIVNCWDLSGKQLVNNGNGLYKSYSQDGTVLLSGKVIKGKRDGKWSTFYANGKIKEEGIYEKEIYKTLNYWDTVGNHNIVDGNGSYISYYPEEGTVFEEGKITEGLKEGTWYVYYPTGEITSEQHYVHGKLNGVQRFYFESGALYSTGEMVDEKRNGEWLWYHENGNLSSSVSYDNDIKEGKQIMWNALGEKVKEEYYEKGELIDEKVL